MSADERRVHDVIAAWWGIPEAVMHPDDVKSAKRVLVYFDALTARLAEAHAALKKHDDVLWYARRVFYQLGHDGAVERIDEVLGNVPTGPAPTPPPTPGGQGTDEGKE